MSTRKRTFDEIQVEISRINRALTDGGDHSVLKPALALLEREAYTALATSRTPQNHVTYMNARDNERANVLRDEIARIDAQLAGEPGIRRGVLQGDRKRLAVMLSMYEFAASEQAASPLLEALEVHTVLMPVSESRPNLKIDELVPTEARIAQYADFRGAGMLVGPESNPVDAETMQAAADALDRYAPLVAGFKEAAEDDDAADAPAEEPVTDDSEDLPF